MAVSKSKLRVKLIIMNIIFLAFSIASIVIMITNPFLSVKGSYKITAETLKSFDESIEEQIDVEEAIGEGVDANFGIKITPKMLLNSFLEKDQDKFVDGVIDENVDAILSDLMPKLTTVINNSVKALAKKQTETQLQERLDTAFGEQVNLDEKLEEAGVDMGEIVDNVFDEFTKEGATVDSFIDELKAQFDEAIAKLKDEFPEQADQLEELNIETMKDDITTLLQEINIADEDGNIKPMEEAVSGLFTAVMGGEEEGEGEPIDLEEAIRNYINGVLTDDIKGTVGLVFKIVAGVLGLFLLTWAWVGLSAFFKSMFAKNPGIFTGLICFLSALIQIIIGLIIGFGLNFILSGKLNIPMIAQILEQIPEGLTVSITASATVPAFLLLAKFVISWFYGPKKRKLKKLIRAEKEDK